MPWLVFSPSRRGEGVRFAIGAASGRCAAAPPAESRCGRVTTRAASARATSGAPPATSGAAAGGHGAPARRRPSRPVSPGRLRRVRAPPRARLAVRAAVGGPVHERLAHHRRAAARGRAALPAVGVERPVEVAALAVDVDVEARRSEVPPAPSASVMHRPDAAEQRASTWAGSTSRSAARSAAGPATAPRRRRCCRRR